MKKDIISVWAKRGEEGREIFTGIKIIKDRKILYSKGKVIHRTKRTANKLAKKYEMKRIPYRTIKLKKGYRVDKIRIK